MSHSLTVLIKSKHLNRDGLISVFNEMLDGFYASIGSAINEEGSPYEGLAFSLYDNAYIVGLHESRTLIGNIIEALTAYGEEATDGECLDEVWGLLETAGYEEHLKRSAAAQEAAYLQRGE